MRDLNTYIKDALLSHGASLVGFGDLSELPADVRENLPVGVSVAVKYPKDIIRGISELPTKEYHEWYNRLNEQLDMLVTLGAEALRAQGYEAVAQTRKHVAFHDSENNFSTPLPHKTVATRAGIGWIGKSALLVTEQYGSMIRLSSILTDAPLNTAKPFNRSQCGGCMVCTDACPAHAVSGKEWSLGVYRDEFFNAAACRKTARERSMRGFGGTETICGKCIEVCPYTRKYMNKADE
jgi:epoxyqueuosine reductase QueG